MEVLTTEQMRSRLDEIMAMKGDEKNDLERKTALIELRCRCLQSTYYEAGDIVNFITEELKLDEEIEKLTKATPGENFMPRARARMKVVASTFMVFFNLVGVTLANTDALRIARVIGFLSGYSENTISQYLRNETAFLPNDIEAIKAQELLNAVGIKAQLVM
jgi:hypothetical protein